MGTTVLAVVVAFVAGLVIGLVASGRAWRDARSDPLTGLLNRRGFDQALARRLRPAERRRTAVSLMLFDVDGLKRSNDRFGHGVGDALLRHVALVLKRQLRETDVVGRIGGDEFAVILPATASDEARSAADRVCAAVAAEPVGRGALPVQVSVSVGVVTAESGESPEELVARADAALGQAKAHGRDRRGVVRRDTLRSASAEAIPRQGGR